MRADWEREALAAVEKAAKERVVGYAQMVLIVAQTLEPLIRADEQKDADRRVDRQILRNAQLWADMRDKVRAMRVEGEDDWNAALGRVLVLFSGDDG